MARIRTVKPEFWTDEGVGECSVSARLLFIASWNFADDQGGLDRSAKQLKAQAFPYDVIDCEPLIQELLGQGLFIEYSADGKKYLHINGFRKHQKIEKPARPRIPLYDDSVKSRGVVGESSPASTGLSLGREGKGSIARAPKASRKKRPVTEIPEDFDLDPELSQYAADRLAEVSITSLLESFRGKAKAKGWVYSNWRQAFQEFVRNCMPTSGHWAAGQYPRAAQEPSKVTAIFR